MTGEEWTEPTQQTNLATKATPTDADDEAEMAAARQSNKGRITHNQCKAPSRPSCPQKSRISDKQQATVVYSLK